MSSRKLYALLHGRDVDIPNTPNEGIVADGEDEDEEVKANRERTNQAFQAIKSCQGDISIAFEKQIARAGNEELEAPHEALIIGKVNEILTYANTCRPLPPKPPKVRRQGPFHTVKRVDPKEGRTKHKEGIIRFTYLFIQATARGMALLDLTLRVLPCR